MKADIPTTVAPHYRVQVSRDYMRAQQLTKGDPRDKSKHIVVKRFFRAHYQLSFPITRLAAAVNAIEGVSFTVPDIQRAATDLVRADVLRAATVRGHRFYELNL